MVWWRICTVAQLEGGVVWWRICAVARLRRRSFGLPKKTKPPRKSAAPATPPARNKRLRADRPPPDPAVPATPHVVTSTAGAYATPEQ